jgi:hypothetical protein
MAKNQIVTDYDDAGFPQLAALTAVVTAPGLQTVKAASGRLLKVVVTTVTASAAITIYDNASAASGTPLLVIPIAAAAGTVYDVNLPAANGITVQSTGATGALTVGYA